MKILGASSLYWTIRKQTNPTTKSQLERNCIAIPGLSVNPYARNKKKTIQHLLENTTAKYEDVAIWHDTVNNSLSKHHSNYNRPLSTKQLIRQLENYPQIKLVVFCPRVGAPNVFQQLCSSQLPTFSVLQYSSNRNYGLRRLLFLRSLEKKTAISEKTSQTISSILKVYAFLVTSELYKGIIRDGYEVWLLLS